ILIANSQHLLFYGCFGVAPRPLRPARPGAPPQVASAASLQPFVTGLAADSETPTQATEVASRLLYQTQKLSSRTHGRTLLPRHGLLLKRSSCHCLKCYPCLRTPVTHVSGTYRGVRGGAQL